MTMKNGVIPVDNHHPNPSRDYMNVHNVVNMFVVDVAWVLVQFALIAKKLREKEYRMISFRRGLIIRLVTTADFLCPALAGRPPKA